MTIIGQNFSLRRGEDRTIRFLIEGGAGTTTATWYTAVNKAAAARDLTLTSGGGGILITAVGADVHVDVTISKVQSEALPLGWRYHELWGVDASGQDRHFSEGGMVVEESLRTIPA